MTQDGGEEMNHDDISDDYSSDSEPQLEPTASRPNRKIMTEWWALSRCLHHHQMKGKHCLDRTGWWQCYRPIISTKCHQWESRPYISSKKTNQQRNHQLSLFMWHGLAPTDNLLFLTAVSLTCIFIIMPLLLVCWFPLFIKHTWHTVSHLHKYSLPWVNAL